MMQVTFDCVTGWEKCLMVWSFSISPILIQLSVMCMHVWDNVGTFLFFFRGIISSQDSSVSQGNTLISPDKKILVWNIGTFNLNLYKTYIIAKIY